MVQAVLVSIGNNCRILVYNPCKELQEVKTKILEELKVLIAAIENDDITTIAAMSTTSEVIYGDEIMVMK